MGISWFDLTRYEHISAQFFCSVTRMVANWSSEGTERTKATWTAPQKQVSVVDILESLGEGGIWDGEVINLNYSGR